MRLCEVRRGTVERGNKEDVEWAFEPRTGGNYFQGSYLLCPVKRGLHISCIRHLPLRRVELFRKGMAKSGVDL